MALQKFIIEREIPEVGTFERNQLRQAAAKSNERNGFLFVYRYDRDNAITRVVFHAHRHIP